MLPGEAELVSEWTGLSGKAKSVKRFEQSNGLDTALYKNYLFFYLLQTDNRARSLVIIAVQRRSVGPSIVRQSNVFIEQFYGYVIFK